MRFALWLCDSYERDPRATRIVNEMHMFILPTMNPDGYKLRRRENGFVSFSKLPDTCEGFQAHACEREDLVASIHL